MVVSHLHTEFEALRRAALDPSPVAGLTHGFYRYPGRFSPQLASAAIRQFSQPGELVLDPFSGGGTTAVEAIATGRSTVCLDISELATFLAKLKTSRVSPHAASVLNTWADVTVRNIRYHDAISETNQPPPEIFQNLTGPARGAIRKLIRVALSGLPDDTDPTVERVARGAILNAAQWAIDGRREVATAVAFRERLHTVIHRMLKDFESLWEQAEAKGVHQPRLVKPRLITSDALNIGSVRPFANGTRADLVVTSPPYPGVHVLYHRWQTGGGRETSVPFWIAAARDGRGESYYTMGGRQGRNYFNLLGERMSAIRRVVRDGARLVQVVGFSKPEAHLSLYLETLGTAGFVEAPLPEAGRIWREVPRRRWHASLRTKAPTAREVVLVHRAS